MAHNQNFLIPKTNLAAFPSVGSMNYLYLAIDTNIIYWYNGSVYVEVGGGGGSGGGPAIYNETLSGTVDGDNKVFTSTKTISSVNRLMVRDVEYTNFSFLGNTVTLADAPTVILGAPVLSYNYPAVTPPLSTIWGTVTTNQVILVGDYGYVTNGSSRVVLTLPTIAPEGSRVQVNAQNSNGFRIAQNAGQQIKVNSDATTIGIGGYIESTAIGNTVELVCMVVNTEWSVVDQEGGLTVA